MKINTKVIKSLFPICQGFARAPGVLVTTKPGEVNYVSTNGRALVCVSVPQSVELPPLRLMVTGEDFARLPKGEIYPVVESLTKAVFDGVEVQSDEFPNWEHLIPALDSFGDMHGDGQMFVSLGADYLATLAQAFEDVQTALIGRRRSDLGKAGVKISYKGPYEPLRFDMVGEGFSIVGVLMPRRT